MRALVGGENVTKFAIFTPSYNKPRYIGEAIESVLAQTFSNFKYVIVDNSTDKRKEVMEVIRSFSDPRIEVYEVCFDKQIRATQPIVSQLMNKYFPHLKRTGEYIKLLADDDLIYPNCLEELNKFFNAHPDVKACYHWVKWFKMLGDEKVRVGETKSQKVFGIDGSPLCQIDGGTFCFHGSCLDSLPLPYCNVIEKEDDRLCDGIFMDAVTKEFPAWPLTKYLSERRFTEVSSFDKVLLKPKKKDIL